MTASVQHKIAVDEHKRQQQQQPAEKRRAKNQVTKKLTLEQIKAVEVRRCEKVKKREAMTGTKARCICILPTKSQKLQLNKAFEACRWVYNKCAETVNSNGKKHKDLTKDLRAKFVNNDAWDLITTTTDAEWANIP